MRYKLGIIVPSWNTAMEYETQRMAQPGTSIHTMRIAHTADTEENVIWMGTQVPAADLAMPTTSWSPAPVTIFCFSITCSTAASWSRSTTACSKSSCAAAASIRRRRSFTTASLRPSSSRHTALIISP